MFNLPPKLSHQPKTPRTQIPQLFKKKKERVLSSMLPLRILPNSTQIKQLLNRQPPLPLLLSKLRMPQQCNQMVLCINQLEPFSQTALLLEVSTTTLREDEMLEERKKERHSQREFKYYLRNNPVN